MIQSPTSTIVYQSNILSSLQQTGITQTSPGGKARAFADIVGDQLGILDASNYFNIGQSLLPYAIGSNLDFIAAIFGMYRLQPITPLVQSTDNNFEFYVNSGTFGSINNGSNITVPSGTQIYSNQPGGPVYTLTADVLLPAASDSIYFAAAALSPGTLANAASGLLTNINFSNYTDSRYGTLLVTNNFGIVAGQNLETDDDFRYRIGLSLQSKNASTQSNLQLAILSVPGVQNVVFVNQAGTYTAYIYGISPNVGASLLNACQAVLNTSTAFPLAGIALAPDLIGISFSTTVTFLPNVSTSDQTAAISTATSAAQSYINNLGVGNPFVINTLASTISAASSNILDVGNPDDPINSIYIWMSRSDGSRYSRTLIQNFTPSTGQRIVCESSITNPIVITAAN